MTKRLERPYVVTMTSVADQGRGSNALTRDAIRLEVAMRVVAKGKPVKLAWDTADEFVREMDFRLPTIEAPKLNETNKQKGTYERSFAD